MTDHLVISVTRARVRAGDLRKDPAHPSPEQDEEAMTETRWTELMVDERLVEAKWLKWLEPTDRKVVWLRASGERWKTVCRKVGLRRAAAHEHWLYALCVIAWRLNGHHIPRGLSKRRLIDKSIAMATN